MHEEHLKFQFTRINKFAECNFEELPYIVASAESNGLKLLMVMEKLRRQK